MADKPEPTKEELRYLEEMRARKEKKDQMRMDIFKR